MFAEYVCEFIQFFKFAELQKLQPAHNVTSSCVVKNQSLDLLTYISYFKVKRGAGIRVWQVGIRVCVLTNKDNCVFLYACHTFIVRVMNRWQRKWREMKFDVSCVCVKVILFFKSLLHPSLSDHAHSCASG